MVIAKCRECEKEYQLNSSDNLGDFQCECGGELDYVEDFEVKNENSIKMKRIHWNTLILGIIVTAFLGFLLGLIGIIIATLCVGYSVDKNYKNGAVHGALAGFIGGFIAVNIGNIISIILPSPTSTEFGLLMIGTLMGFIILYGFTGAICGAIGAFIKQKRS